MNVPRERAQWEQVDSSVVPILRCYPEVDQEKVSKGQKIAQSFLQRALFKASLYSTVQIFQKEELRKKFLLC